MSQMSYREKLMWIARINAINRDPDDVQLTPQQSEARWGAFFAANAGMKPKED